MTDRELLTQALEALEHLHRTGDTQVFDLCYAPELIPALRERLAQPNQSPLDRMAENARELGLDYEPVDTKVNSEAIPEQISEPVGEIVQAFADLTAVSIPIMPPVGTKLYTTPPRREWVGLEPHDMPDGEDPIYDDPRFIAGMVWAAKKLMEKNG